MNTIIWSEIAFCTINSGITFHWVDGQMFKDPMRDTIPAIVRQYIIWIGANIVQTWEAVFHDFTDTFARGGYFRFFSIRYKWGSRWYGTKYWQSRQCRHLNQFANSNINKMNSIRGRNISKEKNFDQTLTFLMSLRAHKIYGLADSSNFSMNRLRSYAMPVRKLPMDMPE